MRISIKDKATPAQIEAILTKICDKHKIRIRSADLYLRFEKDNKFVDTYEPGTFLNDVTISFDKLVGTAPSDIKITKEFEIKTASEVKKEIKEKIAESERKRKEEWEEMRKKWKKGYVGLVKRGKQYRFLMRDRASGGNEFVLREDEKLLFTYFVADRSETKKKLTEKYKDKITGGRAQNPLFDLKDNDIKEIKKTLEEMEKTENA